jgi:hypothetical protein
MVPEVELVGGRDAPVEVEQPGHILANRPDSELAAPCPVRAAIEPTERLFVPHRKRLSHTYITNDEGVRELRIDYGIKEVTFDEERLFAFGETLVREASFTGESATTWGPGYAWDEIRPLLEALLEEGIIKRGDAADDRRGSGLVPSLLAPSVCPVPRSWSLAECESITLDLANHAVELGYIEAVVPVFRLAHPALDADGRQVGEANVYPRHLRLDRETEWRVCQYSGSRYRDDAPMNVTALKAMIKHWKPMMAATLAVRAELQTRLGLSRAPWTIGELYILSCVVLALPAFQLMKRGGSSPQPPLHPVLSSLFRITDGIRMSTQAMLFSVEHTRRADQPLTATELYTHVEQNGVFIGDTGVCAGPKPLIDEFLASAVDGVPAEGISGLTLPPEVQDLLSQLPAAVDYGLHALQAWGVSLSVWLAMSRAYEALLAIFDATMPTTGEDGCARLRARLRADWHVLEQLQITLDYDRGVHQKAYLNAYEQSWRALRSPLGPPTLAQAIAPCPAGPMHLAAATQLRDILGARFSRGELAGSGSEPPIERIVEVLVQYLREEQAILASTTQIQESINVLLERPRPKRLLGVRDFLANYSMSSGVGAFPYLFDLLEDELGLRVACTASTMEVSDRRAG